MVKLSLESGVEVGCAMTLGIYFLSIDKIVHGPGDSGLFKCGRQYGSDASKLRNMINHGIVWSRGPCCCLGPHPVKVHGYLN